MTRTPTPRDQAIEKLLDYTARVEADICDQDTGWFYQWSAAAEKLRNMKHATEPTSANISAAAMDLFVMLRRVEYSILSLDNLPPTLCALDMEQTRKALAKAESAAPTFYIVAWSRGKAGEYTDEYHRLDSLKDARELLARVREHDDLITASLSQEIDGTH